MIGDPYEANDPYARAVSNPAAKDLPPMFIANGQQDSVTPPDVYATFYDTLCRNKVPAELHIYAKSEHGFTLGLGKGHSVVRWTDSFLAWLKDIEMIPPPACKNKIIKIGSIC